MKYITQSLNKVKKIQIINDVVYVLKENELIYECNKRYNVIFNSETIYKYFTYVFSDENFYFDTTTKEKKTIPELENYFYNNVFFKDKVLFTNNNCKIYSFKDKTVIKEFSFFEEGSVCLLLESNFLVRYENKISNYNIDNLNIEWQQSFSDLLPSQETEEISISQEIIEISNVIYFTLNTNNKNICFGLDSETGKVVKQFPNILGDLIQENEYIYFLYYNSITRLNTTNDTIEKWDIQDLLDKEDIGYLYFPRWAVLDGQIYFSQTKGSDIHSGKIGARFGVLDFNKRELIFKDQLDPKYGTIGSIKVSKERLYLHTQDSTLHVFEKE
ncbi:hypothetical protein V3470_13990 [Flavobacterium oreochromis]|uniref:hypothetical protein n=1 Tax=Flavobacterium oreochromis TaxID=2906078 RepID=UPI00385EF19B